MAIFTFEQDSRDHRQEVAKEARGIEERFALNRVIDPARYSANQCPHWLTKNGHRGMREYCRTWNDGRLWDHAKTWKFVDGTRVITLGPYGEPLHQVAEIEKLEANLAPLGVVLAFDASRWYQADYLLFLVPAASPLGAAVAEIRSRNWWSYSMRDAVARVLDESKIRN